MSLHQLAHHVQSAGRGEDKVLVHMTPKEVSGLQALAMAHGGSLTVNPQTGLPEAGFLSSILPMVAGLALAPLTAGTSLAFLGTPLGAAALIGGGTALATGNLGKGLMAGLGAYGGAGLGAGLASVGTAGAAKAAGTSAVEAAKITGGAGGAPIWATPTSGGTTLASQATAANTAAAPSQLDKLVAGTKTLGETGGFSNLYNALPTGTLPSLGIAALGSMSDQKGLPAQKQKALIRPYEYTRTQNQGVYDMGAPMYAATPGSSAERNYFTEQYTALTPYAAPGPEYAADGGLVALAVGGPVEQMSADNAIGGNTMYPQSQLQTPMYSNPMMQRPMPTDVIQQGLNMPVNTYTGEQRFAKGGATAEPQTTGSYQYSYNPQTMQFTQTAAPTPKPATDFGPFNLVARAIAQGVNAQQPPTTPVGTTSGGMAQPMPMPMQSAQPAYTPPPPPAYQTPEEQLGLNAFYSMMNKSLGEMGGYAGGGLSHLGDYSDGGRLLKGPGDGVSDSIPAVIGERQPARLADGEFVVPARIVSELGNGSTEAGARKLYKMMDRVQNARKKSMGEKKVAVDSRADKSLPA